MLRWVVRLARSASTCRRLRTAAQRRPQRCAMRGGATDKNANGGASPNGQDVSCCEGDGIAEPCVPTQCPLLAAEPLAPFGALPIDPFIAEIKAGKCVCPEPQECSA
eukprot:COSAG06_NODE_33308_length_492_cov_0.605598_1_plen_107_part_00